MLTDEGLGVLLEEAAHESETSVHTTHDWPFHHTAAGGQSSPQIPGYVNHRLSHTDSGPTLNQISLQTRSNCGPSEL